MVSNPGRRTALLDAGIEVIAAAGARGLTFRAVDEEAGVPTGTTSNYFANRDALLRELGHYVFVRLTPDADTVAARLAEPPSRELEVALMQDIVARARADRAGYLALFELRLEAARRPELQEAFTARYRANLDEITTAHVEGGFPGGATTALLLYLAMSGLLLEHLTLPGVMDVDDAGLEDLVRALVVAVVPAPEREQLA
ncbi:TetR/AcrR family transcriptional regulator [Mumia zhuanghuii]|uniref:TetR family transcriptional regulator n=1 Tax=Mumia zhuanghuii TaxID=2585211 RepID=A0A5C4MFK1_9ACTN|nr:TetR/AcrR family transcriptional regulator [Mumia zhuanghuii]TNC38842.1 TetR family transcriptional regulator [Mumia zhuanghuii]TNC51779.1 TetR family transcriptional regulator [Mumia zhuanghuii]